MRFMVIVKANEYSERGDLPGPEIFVEMNKYNRMLADAGVMLAGDGLTPSSKGVRVRFEGSQRTVVDGPFAETKELIAGFWILQAKSLEEAVEWVKRAPMDGGVELEVRPIAELEDFGDAVPAEVVEYERRMREDYGSRS